MFEADALKFADRPGFVSLGSAVTYGDMLTAAKAFGAWLQSAGVQPGERVALMMPNCLQYPAALFGVLFAGAVVVNVNPLYTPRELQHQLKDSGAVAIVVMEMFAAALEQAIEGTDVRHVVVTAMGDMMGGLKGAAVSAMMRHVQKLVPAYRLPGSHGWKRVMAGARRLRLQAVETRPEDIAFLQYTSGSTGTPRRVIKHITSLDREACLLANRFGERLAGCSIVASVVPQHLYGLTFRIMLPMAMGLPLHAAMLYYAEQLAALPHDRQYLFISSPAFLKRLDTELTAPPVVMLISAGGMLPWCDVTETHDWLNVWPDEIYGSTETGILAWRHRQADSVPWLAFPGVVFQSEGEICRVTSPLIHEAAGLELDDILHFDSEGLFSIAGRRGRVVKIEEKRISLNEIERRLLEPPVNLRG